MDAARWRLRAALTGAALFAGVVPLAACASKSLPGPQVGCAAAPLTTGTVRSIAPSSVCALGSGLFAAVTPFHVSHCFAQTIRVATGRGSVDVTDLYLESDNATLPNGAPVPFGVIDPLESQLGDVGAAATVHGDFRSVMCVIDGQHIQILRSFRRI